ncbi:MAG: quinone oxidoreductase [Nitriliruptoraceae bacterium]
MLDFVEADDPTPGPDDALVEVTAAGVNFIDCYQRTGLYPVELPVVLGLEGSGIVRAIGRDVTSVHVGDTVAWADGQGSYATLVKVGADRLVRVPQGVDPALAAASMLQGITAHYLTHSTFALGSDHTALVYAAAGGVGRLLVQMAKRRGARVLACTSTPEKAAAVRTLGADEVIAYRDVDVAATVRELTDGHGVDVVYDSVGRTTFDASLASLRPRGMLVLYGQSSGRVEPFDLLRLAQHGSLFVTRPILGHHTRTHSELEWRAHAVLEQIAAGNLDVHVHDRLPLADAADAQRALESGTTSGKLLLTP